MRLSLSRPLVCLYVETTGTSPKLDRVCQIAFVKVFPNGQVQEWESLVNPQVPIPRECTAIHGITDEMVATAPFFNSKEVAGYFAASVANCDYAGYNCQFFDLPMLKEELRRAGIDGNKTFGDGRVVDVFKIFQRNEPRTLSAAARFYLGMEHTDAHSALGDVRMTLEILDAQLLRYEAYEDALPRTPAEIHELLFNTIKEGNVDPEGKIVLRNGIPVLNFSRYAGTPLPQVDDGFLRWAIRQDFNEKVKACFVEELKRRG